MTAAGPAPAPAALSRAERTSSAWVAVAVVLTTATQLRPGGLPVGAGEGMLVAWIAVRLACLAMRPAVPLPRAARPVAYFWAAAVPLLLAGTLARGLLGIPAPPSAPRDVLALALCALTVLLFVAQRQLAERARTAAAWMVGVTVPPLVVLMALGLAGVGTGPLEPWFFTRFRGWAENPNQAALLLAPMPFLALFLRAGATRPRRRLWWTLLAVGAVLAGAATLSDSLALAWTVCGAALAGVWAWHFVARRTTSPLRRGVASVLFPLLGVAVAAAAAPRAFAAVAKVAATLSGDSEGSLRMRVLENGVAAIAASPLVGLGPGAHAGIDAPFSNFESHNSFVDWGTSTGAAGILAYAALLAWAAARAWRRGRDPALVLAVGALVAFSVFHFVLRHPVFWLSLLVAALAAPPAPRGAERTGAGPAPS